MSEHIKYQHSASGVTLYGLVWHNTDILWSTVAGDWVPYVTANRADYVIPLTEQSTSAFYTGDSLADTDGISRAFIYAQLGGSPAEGDTFLDAIELANGAFTTIDTALGVMAGAVDSVVNTLLLASGVIDNMVNTLGGVVRKLFVLVRNDAAIATDMVDEITEINANYGGGGGTFDPTLHSLQAIAAAGGGTQIANAVWDALTSAHVVADSFGEAVSETKTNVSSIDGKIGTPAADLSQDIAALATAIGDARNAIETDTQDIQSRLPAALAAGLMASDVLAISGSTVAADKLEAHAGAVTKIVIGTGSTPTSIVLDPAIGVDGGPPPTQTNTFNGRVVVIVGGALNRQARSIDDYDGTGILTMASPGFTGSALAGVEGVIV